MPLLRPRVITASDVARHPPDTPGEGEPARYEREDPYVSKLIKYVPAEIIAAYVFVSGVLASPKTAWSSGLCVAAIIFLSAITPLWIRYATSDEHHVAHKFQMYSALVAFLVWVFVAGGPWVDLLPDEYQITRPQVGAVLVIIASILIPLLEKIFEKPPRVVQTV